MQACRSWPAHPRNSRNLSRRKSRDRHKLSSTPASRPTRRRLHPTSKHNMHASFTPIDFRARRGKVAASVKAAGFDAYVGTRQGGLHYLSGAFMPWRGAVIVTANGECEFVYWAWDTNRVRQEGHDVNITPFTFSDFTKTIAAKLKELGLEKGRIGIDLAHPGAAQVAPGMICANEYLELKELLPAANIANGVDLLDNVIDRKSTRLNSSHVKISYAVFCLQKKNTTTIFSSTLSILDRSTSQLCPLSLHDALPI